MVGESGSNLGSEFICFQVHLEALDAYFVDRELYKKEYLGVVADAKHFDIETMMVELR